MTEDERDALRALASGLLTGEASEDWRARAERLRALSLPILGDGDPPARRLPPEEWPLPYAPLLGFTRHRRAAEVLGMAAIDAFLTRNPEALAATLSPAIWVAWPNGALLRHSRHELLAVLARGAGRAVSALPKQPRIYGPGEAQGVLARGVFEGIDALLDLSTGVLVTAAVDTPRGPQGRVMVVVGPEPDGHWRARSTLLCSVDEAVVASARASAAEDEAVRVVDRVVRHLELGHSAQVRSLRNQMMPKVWLGGALVEAEALAAHAAEGPDRLDAAERVFLGAELEPVTKLAELLGSEQARAVERQAKSAWRRPFEQLRTKVVTVRLGRYHAKNQAAEPAGRVMGLAVEAEDRDPRGGTITRWRLGGLFEGSDP